MIFRTLYFAQTAQQLIVVILTIVLLPENKLHELALGAVGPLIGWQLDIDLIVVLPSDVSFHEQPAEAAA